MKCSKDATTDARWQFVYSQPSRLGHQVGGYIAAPISCLFAKYDIYRNKKRTTSYLMTGKLMLKGSFRVRVSRKYHTSGKLTTSSSAPFLPPVPTGLSLMLSDRLGSSLFTDQAGTVPANIGDAVLCWKDKSGNGRNYSNGTDSVTYTSGGITGSSISLFATDTSSWLPTFSTGYTIYLVLDVEDSVAYGAISTQTGTVWEVDYTDVTIRWPGQGDHVVSSLPSGLSVFRFRSIPSISGFFSCYGITEFAGNSDNQSFRIDSVNTVTNCFVRAVIVVPTSYLAQKDAAVRSWISAYYPLAKMLPSNSPPQISTNQSSLDVSGNVFAFYTVYLIDSANDLVVTAPTHFEISDDFGSSYHDSITASPSNGNLTLNLRVRSKDSVLGSGNISHTSTGATTVYVSVVNS